MEWLSGSLHDSALLECLPGFSTNIIVCFTKGEVKEKHHTRVLTWESYWKRRKKGPKRGHRRGQ